MAGAVGTGQCPNGGVHVYDITGANELNPVKVGYWNIDEVAPDHQPDALAARPTSSTSTRTRRS